MSSTNGQQICESQDAFFFVVPLAVEGRWRLLRQGDAFDPKWTVIVDLRAGSATLRRYVADGDGDSLFVDEGRYIVAGGKLEIFIEDEDERQRVVAAAPAYPDILSALVTVEEATEAGWDLISRDTYILVREELASSVVTQADLTH